MIYLVWFFLIFLACDCESDGTTDDGDRTIHENAAALDNCLVFPSTGLTLNGVGNSIIDLYEIDHSSKGGQSLLR